jgi:hypothetical protein
MRTSRVNAEQDQRPPPPAAYVEMRALRTVADAGSDDGRNSGEHSALDDWDELDLEPAHAASVAAIPPPTPEPYGILANMQGIDLSMFSFTHNWSKLFRCLDFLINDLVVVFFSISDIVLDVLVCRQFYIQQRMFYFYISVCIFIVAQLSYSFLFTATWGRELSPGKKILTFFIILPFGQFVPFFTWLESFRFEYIDNCLTASGNRHIYIYIFFRFRNCFAGLRPTVDRMVAVDDEGPARDDDMLWGYIQKKYQSHAGFLVEALAEAIPQCVLQTIAIITSGSASTLFIISILQSIVVIASKGYLVSYSIHRLTFIFNYICIVADVFSLFAIISWLFGNDASTIQSQTWVYLLVIGWSLLVVSGFCLVVFSIVDDHLKMRNTMLWNNPEDSNDLWFNIYLVRLVAFTLAVIPVCIVFLTVKLSLIPVCVFKSLNAEHAQRWQFYTALYRFLGLHLTDVRIVVANKFFLQCLDAKDVLGIRLRSYDITRDEFGRLRSRAEKLEQEKMTLRRWLSECVGE